MKYFLDTEFIEDGRTIELISIGIVAEDWREYYAINTEFNPRKASQWVKDKVIAQLPPRGTPEWKSREVIAIEVMAFLKNLPIVDLHHFRSGWTQRLANQITGLKGMRYHPHPKMQDIYNDTLFGSKPEIWGYYSAYDWVVFCQLFGTMMDLPKGFPMYCRDIKQLCDSLGNPKLPEQGKGEHDALADAKWNKRTWEFLHSISR